MPSFSDKSNQFTPEKLTQWIKLILAAAIIVFLSVCIVFFVTFPGEIPTSRENWGQFGDYFGGTLNPILSFFSLIILVLNLTLQSKQLELTRQELNNSKAELEATKEELKKSSAAQEQTAKSLSTQTEFAEISARLNALSSSLSILDQQIQDNTSTGLTLSEAATFKEWQLRKHKIRNEVLLITDRLMKDSAQEKQNQHDKELS
jgi:uncharacterized membrane protein